MKVLAKFVVTSVTDYGNNTKEVTLTAAIKDGTNVDWSKWTPSGKINMSITNPDAAQNFVPGKFVSLTFEFD